jgi:hypothetical protein
MTDLLMKLRELMTIGESTQKFIQFVLVLAAGSGGLMYWVDRWRERVRLQARITSIDALFFEFEVENVGKVTTSLRHAVRVAGYQQCDNRLHRVTNHYEVIPPDRTLPSRAPKRMSASGKVRADGTKVDSDALELLLPRYTFEPTWGSPARVFGREHSHLFSIRSNKHLPELSIFRYWWEVFCLHIALTRKRLALRRKNNAA